MNLRPYFGRRMIRLYIVLTVCAIIAIVYLKQGTFSLGRLFDKDTMLDVWDNPIEGVAQEFVRRVPAMEELLSEFHSCAPTCPPKLEARKAAIIREEWPHLFPRFEIDKDWANNSSAQAALNFFKNSKRLYGRARFIKECVPNIEFSAPHPKVAPYASLNSYDCNPPPGK